MSKHLTLLNPAGEVNLSSIVGTYKIFTRANAHYRMAHGDEPFQIELAGASRQIELYGGLFSVNPQSNLSSIHKTDLIVIPSLNHDYAKVVKGNQAMIDWIGNHYRLGAEIACICTGAFLLAATGLSDGKSCSTHWSATDAFRARFPKVKLQSDRLITDEAGIYTNGGAYSFFNLILYLVGKYYGRETAIYCSKVFQIDMDRHSQAEFAIFSGNKDHGDEIILKAQTYIERSISERIPVEELSSKFFVGRRNFDRRFIKATGLTSLEYRARYNRFVQRS